MSAKPLQMSMLVDFFGNLDGQNSKNLRPHYNNYLSLSENAENEGISRQGVRDPSSGRSYSA
jgi:predicted DNA-binding protein YlxM (UPF0122 family)